MVAAWDFFNNREQDTFGQNLLVNGEAEPGFLTGWTTANTTAIVGGVDIYGDFVFEIDASGYMLQSVTPSFTPQQVEIYGFFYHSDYLLNPPIATDLIVTINYSDGSDDTNYYPVQAALNDDYAGNIFTPGEVEINWSLIYDVIDIDPNKEIDTIDYYITNGSSIKLYADNLSIRLNNNIPVSRSGYNNTRMIDKYGLDPVYLDYFKNMVYNSSFETFDLSTLLPTYWAGTGTSDPNSSFYGSYSCKLDSSEYIETDSSKYVNPAFYDNELTRISFYRKQGQMKLEVYDITNTAYFTLTAEDGSGGTSITFDANSNWQNSRVSAQFDPTENGACTAYKIIITNVHISETGYIDAVMAQPDYTGKWPQIYKDGPKSTLGAENEIVVSATAPSDTTKLWLDIS